MKYAYWAGTEESYEVVLSAKASVIKMVAAYAGVPSTSVPDVPPIWQKQGNLAIVDIAGSLIAGSAGLSAFFGVCGYDDIANALVEAASDPEVKSILLLGSSPGGSVHGVQEVSDLISSIGKVKTINAHVEDVGASACYWLICSAASISLNPAAEVGSIGVLAVHTSYARQLAEAGIDKTLVRSGENKAMTNPIEPLSDAAKADMQAKVNDLSGIFLSHVAKQRDGKLAEADAGAGKMYLGKRAVSAGLADKVMNYDQAVNAAKRSQKG